MTLSLYLYYFIFIYNINNNNNNIFYIKVIKGEGKYSTQ